MLKLFYIVAFVVASQLFVNAQTFKTAADTEFFYGYGGTADDEARSIKELPDGGYIIAGTSASFGQGDASVYLVRTDSMGKHLWSASYGASQNDWAYSVEVTSDSGYFVAGYSNSFGLQQQTGYDTYYFKTDKNGTLQWQKTVAGDDWDFIYGTTPMADGGFILCGETYTHSNGGSDAYLIRINQNGDTLWTKHYGGLFDEKFNSVCVIYDQIYAVGKNATHAVDTIADAWLVKLDTNGNILKEVFVSGPNHYEEIATGITPYANNIFHFCGKTNVLDSNSVIPFLYYADTSLYTNIVPNYFSSTKGSVVAFNHIINISYGSICIVGYAAGGAGGLNMFFIGYDASDAFINAYIHHSGGLLDEYGNDGILTTKGRIIAVGTEQSFCSGGEDVFLVRFENDSISNNAIATTPVLTCFTDTLFLWQAGLNNYSENRQINFYPNPVADLCTLEIKQSKTANYSAKVLSILGTQVFNFNISSNTPVTPNFSSLPNGSYFIKVSDSNGQVISVLKFIVNK